MGESTYLPLEEQLTLYYPGRNNVSGKTERSGGWLVGWLVDRTNTDDDTASTHSIWFSAQTDVAPGITGFNQYAAELVRAARILWFDPIDGIGLSKAKSS